MTATPSAFVCGALQVPTAHASSLSRTTTYRSRPPRTSAGNVASTNGVGGDLELELPAAAGERTLRITLADDEARELAASPHLLSIDIVKRARPSSTETGADAETNAQTPSTTTRDGSDAVLESRA